VSYDSGCPVTARVVLGYSGIDGADAYLNSRTDLVGPERRFYQGMDAAAAVFVDGHLTAAVQQERLTGQKFDNAYPAEAMSWCLAASGVSERDVDVVAHGFDYGRYRRLFEASPAGRQRYEALYAPERQHALLRQYLPALGGRVPVTPVRHHDAHAYSAVTGSGFDECLVVVMDGMGEVDAISVYRWQRGGALHRLVAHDFRSSLGLYYSLITAHLGFEPNSDEYRVMALAAFGDPSRYESVLDEAIQLREAGSLVVPMLASAPDDPNREQYRRGRRWLAEQTFAPRTPDEMLTSQHADLAAAAQQRLERAIEHVVRHWVAQTGLTRLALAGGVALNCVANVRSFGWGVTDLYVQPAAGDEGTSLGAALAMMEPESLPDLPIMPFYGPDIPGGGEPTVTAQHLANGAVVGWAQGRLEFGPRALGNRSILADPRDAATRDRVNSAVKFREGFRPLAPAVLAERTQEFFDVPAGANARHMTLAVPVRPSARAAIPAVVHADGTARVQVVHREDAPGLAALLEQFDRLTGVPVLLNTSLNVKGQPMAATAADAVWTFENSAMDVLYVGDEVRLKDAWIRRSPEGESR
jgi:carbamoyltransferase